MEVVLRCWVPLPGVYGSGLYMGAQKLLGSGAPFSTVVGAAPKICLSAALPPAPLFRARIVWIPIAVRKLPNIRGTSFWGPYNEDPTILGYYTKVPDFRKPPYTIESLVSRTLRPRVISGAILLMI